MTRVAYSYSVLRYVHDPAAGETLNVGVLAYAPSISWVGVQVEKRFQRLSSTFRDFDRDSFRSILRRVEHTVERLHRRLEEELPGIQERPKDVRDIGSQIWPDSDVSFRFGPMFSGITSDPDAMLKELFDRMVQSQTPHVAKPRAEASIWQLFSAAFEQESILTLLRPKVFEVAGSNIQFEHAFKNGKWHVLQPVTMDYKTPGKLEREAHLWLGRGTALKDHPELGTLYLLLGRPSLDSSEINRAFQSAKRLLAKMPTPSEIVEEDDSVRFAQELANFIARH